MSYKPDAHSNTQIALRYCTLLFLLYLPGIQAQAGNENSDIEITHSSVSDTLESITTLGIYSSLSNRRSMGLYVGVQFATFNISPTVDQETIFRVVSGIAIPGRISPYIEIGTGLVGLLLLADDQEKNCADDNQCQIDSFLRGGIRIQLTQKVHIGVFREKISFGDFHDRLKGDHTYTGGSISISF